MDSTQSVPLPDPVAKFFHGKPMTPELQAAFEAVLSEDFELRFVGEFVPGYAKPIVLDKSKFPVRSRTCKPRSRTSRSRPPNR